MWHGTHVTLINPRSRLCERMRERLRHRFLSRSRSLAVSFFLSKKIYFMKLYCIFLAIDVTSKTKQHYYVV